MQIDFRDVWWWWENTSYNDDDAMAFQSNNSKKKHLFYSCTCIAESGQYISGFGEIDGGTWINHFLIFCLQFLMVVWSLDLRWLSLLWNDLSSKARWLRLDSCFVVKVFLSRYWIWLMTFKMVIIRWGWDLCQCSLSFVSKTPSHVNLCTGEI